MYRIDLSKKLNRETHLYLAVVLNALARLVLPEST